MKLLVAHLTVRDRAYAVVTFIHGVRSRGGDCFTRLCPAARRLAPLVLDECAVHSSSVPIDKRRRARLHGSGGGSHVACDWVNERKRCH